MALFRVPAMGDEEPMKKKRRYSRERDLEVVVEGEVFRAHSHDLMVASDVFATTLQANWCESEQGRISLERAEMALGQICCNLLIIGFVLLAGSRSIDSKSAWQKI